MAWCDYCHVDVPTANAGEACPTCGYRLSGYTAAAPVLPYVPAPVAGFVCPNCGYRGRAKRKAKGSRIVLIVLLLIMVLPGLLYMVMYSGYVLACPNCGLKIGDAA